MNPDTHGTAAKGTSLRHVLPVLFGFFIMGFVDLIGTAINYVKADFSLNDSMANLLALSCFFWFLVLSIPTGFLMNRVGRKNTVLISFLFTFSGLLIPWMVYNFTFILIAFALIGIGNTIIQVALNPLVSNVVAKEKLTGSLTLGQFIKALSSWLGPNVAAWLTITTLGWKFVFPVFALVSLLAAVWLWATHIDEETGDRKEVSFAATFSLLKNRKILLFFIGILVLVGVDVGLNATLPKYLMEKCADIADVSQADQLKSYFYFIVRALGAFLGGILLMKIPERKFYAISALLALVGLIGLLISHSQWSILASVVVIALGYSNLFAIIFSLALKELPEKANEISSLLIVGVSGGVIAQLLGVVSDTFHTQWAAIAILAVIWLYMIGLIRTINKA
ncbi:MAG: MFS transporter [Tannerellaceae bacterium]|jgi:fucose permease|nr:MFS transporter [Tannerellaceae bacterium]